jgi:hypothetical protein
MKRLRVALLGALFAGSSVVAADEANGRPSVGQFAWLAGTWSFEKGGRVVTEHWLPPEGGTMLAVSRTISGDRTVEYEFLVLREDAAGAIVLEAHPSGQKATAFQLVRAGAREVVFENLQHDFPQRVIYALTGPETLLAAIEGERDGRTRRIEFPYKRVAPQS